MAKRVLIVGSGGREHALGWSFRNAGYDVFIAPGNGGTGDVGKNIPINAVSIQELALFAEKNCIDLTVVGGEVPLSLGISDLFRDRGLRIFGPSKAAMEIEASKLFSKAVMREAGIPTAKFRTFTDYSLAKDYLFLCHPPYVIKAIGLAFGKGVYVCQCLDDAETALRELLVEHKHGDAGKEIIIEDFILGEEVSATAITDGGNIAMLSPARDYKRLRNFDQGPNTGGMGAIAPVPGFCDQEQLQVSNRILKPLLMNLKSREIDYTGCIYAGLMLNNFGQYVLEFNARFGDPEMEVLVRLARNFPELIEAATEGVLEEIQPKNNLGYAVCIVMTSKDYPRDSSIGAPISGIDEAEKITGIKVFHCGTRFVNGKFETNGGRILAISAVGSTLAAAIESAYAGVRCVSFQGMHYRTDIGADAL